jgi:hypothetical protein
VGTQSQGPLVGSPAAEGANPLEPTIYTKDFTMTRRTFAFLSVSLFACNSFEEQSQGQEPTASYVIVEGDTPQTAENNSSANVVMEIPELNLAVYEVEEGSIEENNTSADLNHETVVADEQNELVLNKDISEQSEILESVQEKEIQSIFAISNVPTTVLAEIQSEQDVSIANEGERALYTSEILRALVVATRDQADIVYIPLHSENIPVVLFEAIDFGTEKGVQFFDANGARL